MAGSRHVVAKAALVLTVLGGLVPMTARADLVVLAAPADSNGYYAEVADDIFRFQIDFARRIGGADRVLVLADTDSYGRYAEALGRDRVVLTPMQDIWIRDYAAANPARPVLFRYTAAGQGGGREGQVAADAVQEDLAALIAEADLPYRETDLLNDGGNFVEDGAGNAVLSTKFLSDNGLTETAARQALRKLANLRNVAFIEVDEQGGLEHADGVVAFVAENTLIVNSYPEDPGYARRLEKDLRRGLPGVALHWIPAPYDDRRVYDDRFGSACGLYTNALVTERRVYLPQFGIPEDLVALKQVEAATRRKVVPVPAWQVCHMGGGLRCLTWQLRDRNGDRLRAFFGLGD